MPDLNGPELARAIGVGTFPVTALLTFPTGAGKTYLARSAAQVALRAGRTVMVVAPIRALVEEIAGTWREALPGVTVQAYTRDTLNARPYRQTQVIVLTPERLDLLTRAWRRHHPWLARVGLLVVDEVHLLSDPVRGATLDGAVTRFRAAYPLAQMLALSATCGNPSEVARWMGGVHVGGGERPSPLEWHAVTTYGDFARKVTALQGTLRPGEPTLVFVNGRQRAENVAAALLNAGHVAGAHHAGLNAATRLTVEQAFREGRVNVLVCTPTLELGVNLPAAHVVLMDLTSPAGGRWEAISVNTAWQRAGRAGRTAGTTARVTLMRTHQERASHYQEGRFEALRSPLLHNVNFLNFVLGSVDGGYARTETQLTRLTRATLAGQQATQANIPGALETLITQGGLERTETGLRVTQAGRIASAALLPVPVVTQVRYLPDDPTFLDVLILAAQVTPDAQLFTESDVLRDLARHTPSRVLDGAPEITTDRARYQPDSSSRWTAHGPQGVTAPAVRGALAALLASRDGDAETAATLNLYEGQVTALRVALTRVLDAWTRLDDRVKLRLAQVALSAQLPLDAATLALLPGVGHVTACALAARGVTDIELLAQSDPQRLHVPGVRPERLAQWIERAQALVAGFDVDPTREPLPAANRAAPPEQPDPARLARAYALTVTPTGPDEYTVTGGSEPRTVHGQRCSCPDHRRTLLCKHVLATNLYRGRHLSAPRDPQAQAISYPTADPFRLPSR